MFGGSDDEADKPATQKPKAAGPPKVPARPAASVIKAAEREHANATKTAATNATAAKKADSDSDSDDEGGFFSNLWSSSGNSTMKKAAAEA